MRTLLIGGPETSWRSWVKHNDGNSAVLWLDPADPLQAPPGRATLFVAEKFITSRFIGTLEWPKAPHVLLSALSSLLREEFRDLETEDLIVQFPPLRPTPLAFQTLMLAEDVLRPDRIVIAEGTQVRRDGFRIGPEEVQVPAAFPALVQRAQRKAHWLKWIEGGSSQQVRFDGLSLQGSRIGSGERLPFSEISEFRSEGVVYGEILGKSLFLISNNQLSDSATSRLMNRFHAEKLHIASPSDYRNLYCGLAKQDGEDFALGLIQSIDFEAGMLNIFTDAIPPAPIHMLRLGQIRVDLDGNELAEAHPWSV